MNGNPKYPQFAVQQEDGKWVPRTYGWYSDDALGLYVGQWAVRTEGPDYSSANKEFVASYTPAIFKMEGTKGENTILIGNMGNPDKYFPLYPSKKVAVWVAAIDKAGNITAPIQPLEYTTTKAMPKVETAPKLNGTYGDTIQQLSLVDGIAKYGDTEIKGTWKLTDTRDTILPVGTQETCEVTFTPDAELQNQYESITVKVVPTIEKRPITIRVGNITREYGDPLPEISDISFVIVDESAALVGSDTKETIQSTLQLIGSWVQEQHPSAGKWFFTVSSNSTNYEVAVKYYENLSEATVEQGSGILHIEEAPWEFVKVTGYQDEWNVTYGTDAFPLAVEGKLGENRLTYTVEDAKDADGNAIPSGEIKERLLHISDTGEVTVKGTGSATIRIAVPEYMGKLYTWTEEEDSITVKVNIAKATVSPEAEVKAVGTLTYGESLSKLKLTDTVFYREGSTVEVPGTIAWKDSDAILNAGTQNVEYVFTPDSTVAQNYKPYTGTVSVTVNKATPTIERLPVPNETIYHPMLPYGNQLLHEAKDAGLVNGVDGNWLAGEWWFKDQTVLLSVGTSSQEIYFKPESANYNEVTAFVNVTVVKAVPYISTQPTATYTHGDSLYNQQPTGGKAIWGDGKGGASSGAAGTDMEVPGTFTWKTASGQLTHMGDNGKEFEYIFTPEDKTSYETVTGTIAITVKKAKYPPLNPAGTIHASSSCEKVGDVELPQGWKWSENDAGKELTVGGSQSNVHAEYTEADADNYENIKVSMTVVRTDCDHAQTTIEGAKKATCVETGTTGNVVCKICNTIVSSGYPIPKDPTNHTALTEKVIKAATRTEEGLAEYSCADCGYQETKTIARLKGGSSSSSHHSSSENGTTSSTGTVSAASILQAASQTQGIKTDLTKTKLSGTTGTNADSGSGEAQNSLTEDSEDQMTGQAADGTEEEQTDITDGDLMNEDPVEEAASEDVKAETSESSIWIVLLVIAVILAGSGFFFILAAKRKKKEEEQG